MNRWLKASRPLTLPASICPVLIGTKLSLDFNQNLNLVYFFIILLTAVLIQINTNYVNDLCDFLKGSDDENRVGPKRMLASGIINSSEMKKAIFILTLLLILLGSYLVSVGGLSILVIGMLSILFSYLYTAGPYPLAYLGLGEIFVIAFFGSVASWGTTWILLGQQSLSSSIYYGLVPGFISSAILVVNNLRDFTQDKESNKKTLVVRFGKLFGKLEYFSFLLLANLILILKSKVFLILLPATLFLSYKVYLFKEPRDLFPILGQTSLLLLASTILFMAI